MTAPSPYPLAAVHEADALAELLALFVAAQPPLDTKALARRVLARVDPEPPRAA